MEVLVLLLGWAIPLIISYLFWVAQTIVLGMRSVNSHLERIAAAVKSRPRRIEGGVHSP